MRKALQLLLLAPLAFLACDKASPVAPEGSVLTISASPNRIAAGGTSTITVTARKSNGFPVNPGSTVFFSTTRGTMPASGTTNDEGVVRAVLNGNGEVGMATVKANAGAAEEAETTVQIGIFAASVTLQASPTTIQSNGGQIDLLAVVRDDAGQPLPGATVNFTSQLGTLDSAGGLVATNSGGEAADILRVRARDVNATTASSFEVGVEVPKADGTLLTRTRTITIQRETP
ncbi:MAG TPA: Ig-like domain-containing protein [Thermoanaerobaculia bacterium]|jgi:hypothetical protein|nr:Ig-like domain-containing protein [Thermoanaerobaculia bacterium]